MVDHRQGVIPADRELQSLLAQGREVRILVRPGSPYPPLVEAGARPVVGDLKEPASLVAACAGAETVITTASAGQRGGGDTPQTVDLEGNRHLIDAARAAGMRQFAFVSALTADEASPVLLARAKAQTEAQSATLTLRIMSIGGMDAATIRAPLDELGAIIDRIQLYHAGALNALTAPETLPASARVLPRAGPHSAPATRFNGRVGTKQIMAAA